MRVGFVGLGAMGTLMARNLLRAGHQVKGYDVRLEATAQLASQGGTAAATPQDVCKDIDVLLLMVVNADQAESFFSAADIAPHAIVAAMLTQPQARVKAQGEQLAAKGIALLDAPVSGGTAGAEAATLTIMASGPKPTFEACRPLFEALGKNIYWLGEEHGKGSAAKSINQHLAGVHLAAAAEALAFAEKAGLPLPLVHELISRSAGNSWMWSDRGPRMLQDEPQVTSAVDIFVKDMSIVTDAAHEIGAALPLATEALHMFKTASEQGHGRADDSQVIRAYRKLNS